MSKIKNTKQMFLCTGLLVTLAGTSNIYGMKEGNDTTSKVSEVSLGTPSNEISLGNFEEAVFEKAIKKPNSQNLSDALRLSKTLDPCVQEAFFNRLQKRWRLNITPSLLKEFIPFKAWITSIKLVIGSKDPFANEMLRSVVEEFPNLTDLDLRGTGVTDISCLKDHTKLDYLDLSHTIVADFSILQTISNLTELALVDTNITAEDLQHLPKSLTELDLSLTDITDFSSLKKLANLQVLGLEEGKKLREKELQVFLDCL